MNFTKVFSLFALLVLAVLSVSVVSAVSLSSWVLSTDGTSSGVASNVNAGLFTASSGVTNFGFGTNGATAESWSIGLLDSTKYLETTISPTAGNNLVINAINFGERRSLTGIRDYQVQWSKSTTFSSPTIIATVNVADDDIERIGNIIGLNIAVNNGETLRIRWFGYNAERSTGTWRINDNTLNIDGTITPIPTSTNLSISVSTTPFTVSQNASLTISNSATSALSGNITEIGSTLFGVTFSPNTFNLAGGASSTFNAVLSNLQNLKFGTNTVNVQASAGTQTATANFQVRKTFCSAVPLVANLSIKSIDVSNDGEGDENEWELLDEIDVELEIDNNDQDEDIDVIVELGLFDNDGKNIADDLDFTSDSDSDNEEIELSIDEDDSATVNFKFRVPADFDTGNYRLAFKVYDDDAGESKSCRDVSSDLDEGFFESIDIKEASDEGRFVVVDEFNIDSQVVCGSTLSGQFTIFNVGEEDQDRVNVIIKNNELNINEEVEFTSDLDKGDEETLSFSVIIPSTASNGIKNLEFITEYDYKNGVYREDADESSVFPIEIIGCSQNLGNTGSVSGLTNTNIEAELSSDAIAGQELIVTSTITNTGTASKSYTIDSIGYSEWAELTDISDESFSLDAGESQEIVFKFLVNEDSSGNQAFDIQLSSEGKVQVQEVEVELAEASKGFSLNLKGNSTLWIIGLVNVALILLIIVVAVRLSRK